MEKLKTRRILDLGQTLRDTFADGWHYALPITGCFLLWFATMWIPYINIGTMIAITMLPVELANRRRIAPLSIFSARYRRDRGLYLRATRLQILLPAVAMFFLLVCMMALMLGPAAFFSWKGGVAVLLLLILISAFAPLAVLKGNWSMAEYYIYERQLSPDEAKTAWARAIYGSKKRMTVLELLLVVLALLFGLIIGLIALHNMVIAVMVGALFVTLFLSFAAAYNASVWRQLKDNDEQA